MFAVYCLRLFVATYIVALFNFLKFVFTSFDVVFEFKPISVEYFLSLLFFFSIKTNCYIFFEQYVDLSFKLSHV